MGLKQNGTLQAQYPLRQIGGGVAGERSMWGRSEQRNQFLGEGIVDKLAGMPNGHIHPSSWCMARLPGMISSYVGLDAILVVNSLNLAGGVNGSSAVNMTLTVAAAPLQLIAAASGTIALTLTPSATVTGVIGITGTCSATLTVASAPVQATFSASGTATGSLSTIGVIRATGNLEGSITPYTALSPQSLSQAVWETLASEANKVGTMGAKLNSAGTGGGGGTGGLTPSEAIMLLDIYKRLGLDRTAPLTTTPTGITANGIDIVLTGDGETSTTATRQ